MTFGPDIPAVEHEAFAKPPLKAMLGQIRFPTVLKIADLGALGGLQEAIRDTWPEFAQEQQLSVVVGPGDLSRRKRRVPFVSRRGGNLERSPHTG